MRAPWVRWGSMLLVAIPVGVVAALLTVYAVTMASPVKRDRAVITAAFTTRHEDRYGASYSHHVQALTDDGRALDLGGGGAKSVYRKAESGEPVVVSRATWTGQVTGVRTVEGYVSYDRYVGAYVLVLLGILGLVAYAVFARRLARWWPPLLMAVVIAAGYGATAAIDLADGPAISHTGTPLSGMRSYDEPQFAPKKNVLPGAVGGDDEFDLKVTGPVAYGSPSGGWLREFNVLSIPVTATYHGQFDRGSTPLHLIGSGAGVAVSVPSALCGHSAVRADGSDLKGGTDPATVGGRICYVVPPHFSPHALVLGAVGQDVLIPLG